MGALWWQDMWLIEQIVVYYINQTLSAFYHTAHKCICLCPNNNSTDSTTPLVFYELLHMDKFDVQWICMSGSKVTMVTRWTAHSLKIWGLFHEAHIAKIGLDSVCCRDTQSNYLNQLSTKNASWNQPMITHLYLICVSSATIYVECL